jgi:hypothetical protein
MVTKEEVLQELARKHYLAEPSITEIYSIHSRPEREAEPGEPIKLLEVNQDTIPSGIMPLGFDAVPASGFPYPSVIIEVTPEEMLKIRARELLLPHGWILGSLLPRSSEGNGND